MKWNSTASAMFMGDSLGGRPDDETCYVNGKVDYEKVKATASYQRGIQRLHTAFSQQQSVALMCSEGKPEECHRCKLIGATLTNENIPVIHIDENDEQLTQAEVVERLTGGQLSMFGEDTFHSQKNTRNSVHYENKKNNAVNNHLCALLPINSKNNRSAYASPLRARIGLRNRNTTK